MEGRADALYLFDDVGDIGGPDQRLGVFVVMVDVFADGIDELFDVAKDAAARPVVDQVERVRDWFLTPGGSFSTSSDTTPPAGLACCGVGISSPARRLRTATNGSSICPGSAPCKSDDTLQGSERMLHLYPSSGLGRVLSLGLFIRIILEPGSAVGHVRRLGCSS
jgi:hypothetical protein